MVINEVDKLTKEAQHALRRTMELYVNHCRLIMIGKNSSKVIEPLRSRCLTIRVAGPTISETEKILQSIAKKENLNLPPQLANNIAVQSERNLRRAVLMLEATRVKQYPLQADQQTEHPAWEDYIVKTAKQMVKKFLQKSYYLCATAKKFFPAFLNLVVKAEEQSPRCLAEIRVRLYDLLVRSIPPDVIFKCLVVELFKKIDDEAKIEISQWAGNDANLCYKKIYIFQKKK